MGEQHAAARERERLRALQAYRSSDQAPEEALEPDALLERLSRELRTPLNAILGFAQLLSLEVSEPGQRGLVDQILRAGDELQSLLDGLVGATHESAGGAVPESVPLEQSAQVAYDRVALLARARSVAVQAPRRTAGTDQRAVHADPVLLHDAVFEVLAAAVRRAHSEVGWSCAAKGDRVLLTVVDDGLPAPASAGLDLGLAVARRLVALLDGALTVGATADGRRAVVLDLPASDGAGAATGPAAGESLDVLYIEDNASNARLVQRLIARRSGIALTVVRTGVEGLALARSARPDVVLLDLHLPDLPGEHVLSELRAQGDGPTVVLLTADAVPATIERLLASGAEDYLTKPLDVARFYEVLDRLQHEHQRRRAS